ncbi:MAG: cytochrome c [Gammaproteobacteria bacterium]|nr:cytochrome c [Gammaproteobacteria bacterium]
MKFPRIIVAYVCASAALLNASADAVHDARARQNYMLNCQGCHLPDGSGSPGSVPNLRVSLDDLLRAPGGRDFLIRVPGAANSALDDEQLAEVMNWMLLNFTRDPPAGGLTPYSAEEVGRLRKDVLVDVNTVRAAILELNQ